MVSALSRWSTASPINATEFGRLVYHPADELQQNSQPTQLHLHHAAAEHSAGLGADIELSTNRSGANAIKVTPKCHNSRSSGECGASARTHIPEQQMIRFRKQSRSDRSSEGYYARNFWKITFQTRDGSYSVLSISSRSNQTDNPTAQVRCPRHAWQ
ncbi:hypothetical protein BGW80DRAFT_1299502 [Lactifluus volemus]|nr:hypothetical protein BGW80DRAFT_1299502 [Lactifluus volemus]